MAGRGSAGSGVCFDLFRNDLGWALAVAREGALVWLGHFQRPEPAEGALRRSWPEAVADSASPLLSEVRRQLAEYLAGRRHAFEVPLALEGTEFQRLCWEALRRIPYGETRTYGELARQIGRPAAVRAVGRANHDNPVGVIVPCHRVIGADGSLTGYAGGLEMKQWLLELEGAIPRKLDLTS